MRHYQPSQTVSQEVRNELAAFERAAVEARSIAAQTDTNLIVQRGNHLVRLSGEDWVDKKMTI